MKREEELMQIKKERDEMEKHMTDMFDLAFMLNNRNDIMSPQAHYEKLARMVTHYMGSIQQSYGYMADKAIELLEQEPKTGHWIEKGHYFERCWARCSICGRTASGHSKDTGSGFMRSYTDYCPNCGAKMESEET